MCMMGCVRWGAPRRRNSSKPCWFRIGWVASKPNSFYHRPSRPEPDRASRQPKSSLILRFLSLTTIILPRPWLPTSAERRSVRGTSVLFLEGCLSLHARLSCVLRNHASRCSGGNPDSSIISTTFMISTKRSRYIWAPFCSTPVRSPGQHALSCVDLAGIIIKPWEKRWLSRIHLHSYL